MQVTDDMIRVACNAYGASSGSCEFEWMRAALTAAPAVDGVALQGWQPIESAPRDGKPFLAWEDEERGPFKCWWYENWPSDEAYWMDHACTEPQPTHWQPLPQPPAASEGEKRK